MDESLSGTYHDVPCTIIAKRHGPQGIWWLLEAESDIEGKFWSGAKPPVTIPAGMATVLDPKKFYFWISSTDPNWAKALPVAVKYGYNCCECNGRNEYAAANLKKDRFICWSCSDSYRWKYEDDFLPNHRFYHKPSVKQ